MNFFEYQDQARKQSRWLILVFIVAVLAVVAAIDLILLLVLGEPAVPGQEWQPLSNLSFGNNLPLLAGGGIVTVLTIGMASLYKSIKLQAGGGQVARELGGTLLESDPGDPLRRRLRNVVEEIAIASGVPVPEIYVLEQEGGINAFAAGFSPSDAAIAVTRGTLESLNRDELQGVIAHEFSHILNGDMRINIRLMGALFGILLLALIGRRVLIHTRHVGSSRDKSGVAILLIAVGIMAVGYIGQFFGRWIKAAISRQREYLADASAVQFTRNPEGISGALKKIAVVSNGSFMDADTEEISHMLFGDGRKMNLFSTHPPLDQRIRRIEPNFTKSDLDRLRAKMVKEQLKSAKDREEQAARAATKAERKEEGGGGADWADPSRWIDQIGQPHMERILMAAALTATISENVRQAAQSAEWAPEVLFYTLLDSNRDIREQQLLLIARRMGSDSEAQVSALLSGSGVATPAQRLPLLELAFTALKRRPPELVSRVLETVKELVQLDGQIDVFEFLLAKVITQHLWESQNPEKARMSGSLQLSVCHNEVARVLAVLAIHGHDELQEAKAAFEAGWGVLGMPGMTTMPAIENWVNTLDTDLPKLDRLRATEKQKLVSALIATVAFDRLAVPAELELLRVICSLIHVPLPMLVSGEAD
ncbi:MAG TPA: M48 family metallopeptidase [Xanthomonadales bacterium]|nr:M48 family metallopeptidase [Xanthomonadales bacterium]